MIEIVSLLVCLQPALSRTTIAQLSRIGLALLAMTGRVTMLGISRWTDRGGSYRTVQRFFNTVILRSSGQVPLGASVLAVLPNTSVPAR